jgi:hypothetical protein
MTERKVIGVFAQPPSIQSGIASGSASDTNGLMMVAHLGRPEVIGARTGPSDPTRSSEKHQLYASADKDTRENKPGCNLA